MFRWPYAVCLRVCACVCVPLGVIGMLLHFCFSFSLAIAVNAHREALTFVFAGGQWSFQQSLPNKDTADRM